MKAFHIIAVIAWMVALLYLPRLFVYHSEREKDSIAYEVFLLMEKRLIKIIMLPSDLVKYKKESRIVATLHIDFVFDF